MWWIFQKTHEDEYSIRYAYSRENRNLDGIIQYDKETKETVLIRAGQNDIRSDGTVNRAAIGKFYWVIKENFPDKWQVACG